MTRLLASFCDRDSVHHVYQQESRSVICNVYKQSPNLPQSRQIVNLQYNVSHVLQRALFTHTCENINWYNNYTYFEVTQELGLEQ